MQGLRTSVDTCAMGWAPRVWVAMELLVKRNLCFALDSGECIFYSLKSLANNPPTDPFVGRMVGSKKTGLSLTFRMLVTRHQRVHPFFR